MSRYELLERIGAGGMAEIFRGKAVAAGGFEKPVAIKRILPHLSKDERFVELLISEAKILSRLRHRNIVQIYDVGLAEDGQYFLVMEFVDGSDLARLYGLLERQQTRIPLDVALHIGAEVCEALDHAHRAVDEQGQPIRLVHRDVSPSNVLLSRSGEVKLTDFGIAKSIEEATGHGGVRGKFAYISPEQARNVHVDGRSDEYALAIIVFELLTGRPLYSGMADFDALGATRDPKPVHVRQIDPSIPVELERIIERALAPRPDDRYPTAGEFGSALRTYRYSLDETSGDPAKVIAEYVQEASLEDEDEDDARTVMREVPIGAGQPSPTPSAGEDEETKAISILGGEAASITFSSLPVVSVPRPSAQPMGHPSAQPMGQASAQPMGQAMMAPVAMGKRASQNRMPNLSMPLPAGGPVGLGAGGPAGLGAGGPGGLGAGGPGGLGAGGPGGPAGVPATATRAETPAALAHEGRSDLMHLAPPAANYRPHGRPVEQLTPPPSLVAQGPPIRVVSWKMMVGLAVLATVIAMAAFLIAGKVMARSSDTGSSDADMPSKSDGN